MQGQTNKRIMRGRLQRALRNRPTEAEHCLWQCLRSRQLEGCKFRRQHPFGDYILDFSCLEQKLVVELDGSQHIDNVAYDLARTRFLEKAGFVVLRFWNNEVFENIEGVVEVILGELKNKTRTTPSPPNPPLEGEGSSLAPPPPNLEGSSLTPIPPNPPLEGKGQQQNHDVQ